MNWEIIKGILELLLGGGILATLLRGVLVVGRFTSLWEEYPPHRHISRRQIIYPKGMAPEEAKDEEHVGARA